MSLVFLADLLTERIIKEPQEDIDVLGRGGRVLLVVCVRLGGLVLLESRAVMDQHRVRRLDLDLLAREGRARVVVDHGREGVDEVPGPDYHGRGLRLADLHVGFFLLLGA